MKQALAMPCIVPVLRVTASLVLFVQSSAITLDTPVAPRLSPAPAPQERPLLRGSAAVGANLGCGMIVLGLSQAEQPGSIMDPESLRPYNKVYKDGFTKVDCIKDYLYEHGNTSGDNEVLHKLGDVSNVSIVHYDARIAQEDRQPMNHQECYLFCRTIKGMGFFGITNGRNCYCSSSFKAEAGDGSQCDRTCEGDGTTTCGGKTKSEVFAMHKCGDLQSAFKGAKMVASDAQALLAKAEEDAVTLLDAITKNSESLQSVFAEVGNVGASNLMQSVKAIAAKFSQRLDDAKKADAKVTELMDVASEIKKARNAEEIKKVEAITDDMDAAAISAENMARTLRNGIATAGVVARGVKGAAKQYHPIMYFVDKTQQKWPSTCSGTPVGSPLVATEDQCAHACDGNGPDCDGFSYFPFIGAAPPKGFCFLLARHNTATYYTKCEDSLVRFRCYGKFSHLNGRAKILEKATKVDRCFI